MIDINDFELLKLEEVNNWAASYQKKHISIDQFTKDLEEKINHAGFSCEVKVYDTNQAGAYGFDIELTGRLGSIFDPDRMVHEVTTNVLELPDADKGFIKTKDAAKALLNRDVPKTNHKH
jgi:hypothetical protein